VPYQADGPPSRYLILSNAAVTTSGDAFQHVDIGGKRYSHIVDPRTGIGLTDHSLVTVIAQDGITADALATAVSVLGPDKGIKLVEATKGAAVHISRLSGSEIEVSESRGFKRHHEKPPM
jgi:thiamine biosynthesis lipoprotein